MSLPASFLAIVGPGHHFTFHNTTDIGCIVGPHIIGTPAGRHGMFNTMLLTMALTAIGSSGDAAATDIITIHPSGGSLMG